MSIPVSLDLPMTLPNYITAGRIFLIPIFIAFFYLPFSWSSLAAAVVFGLAALTDWLDGYLARYFSATSSFGEFLDPVADKLLVVVALVLLISEHRFPWITFPVVIIICREIVISALREWMAEVGKRTSTTVSYVGKIKTIFQMFAIISLLAYPSYPVLWLYQFGYLTLYTATLLTLWSMSMYIKTAWPSLMVWPSSKRGHAHASKQSTRHPRS